MSIVLNKGMRIAARRNFEFVESEKRNFRMFFRLAADLEAHPTLNVERIESRIFELTVSAEVQ